VAIRPDYIGAILFHRTAPSQPATYAASCH
jgi:hypothetical protein